MRKIFKRKREDFSKLKNVVDVDSKKAQEALPPIVKDTGGSIGNLPIKTEAFKKWLGEVRENINPLIGKSYLTAAPEYSSEDKMVGETKVLDISELGKLAKENYEEELPESPKDNSDTEEKFIDINIIENAVREALGKSEDEIENLAMKKMREYHEDKKYETSLDIGKVIFNYKQNLIAREESRKMIEKDKESDEKPGEDSDEK